MPGPRSETRLENSTSPVRVLHRSVTIPACFAEVTKELENLLGHFPSDIQRDFVQRPSLAEERIEAAEGAEELMIFSAFDHGAALNMVGARRNAKQYLIGNPLTAIQISRHDIRAAHYAPLRVLVFEELRSAQSSSTISLPHNSGSFSAKT